MSAPAKRRRVSASSIKALCHCSLAFYYARILKLPEKQWSRTVIGTLCHSILEALRKERHRRHYDLVVKPGEGVDYRLSPAIVRLVGWYQRKHRIDQALIDDLNDMLHVAINCIDFLWTKADVDPATGKPLIYGPEHEFSLILDDGTEIKGFIDDMAQMAGIMEIRDYKSAREKPPKKEVPSTIQALIYQLYVWLTFGLLARVTFVYLRHPPTKRHPRLHLQVVEPSSETHLKGLASYVKAISARVNAFELEDAYIQPCEDIGFCQRVCTHYAPHPYWVVCAEDDPNGANPLSRHLSLDEASEAAQNVPKGHILERRHQGCALRWNPNQLTSR